MIQSVPAIVLGLEIPETVLDDVRGHDRCTNKEWEKGKYSADVTGL